MFSHSSVRLRVCVAASTTNYYYFSTTTFVLPRAPISKFVLRKQTAAYNSSYLKLRVHLSSYDDFVPTCALVLAPTLTLTPHFVKPKKQNITPHFVSRLAMGPENSQVLLLVGKQDAAGVWPSFNTRIIRKAKHQPTSFQIQ